MKVLVISDNLFILKKFSKLVLEKKYKGATFEYRCSPSSEKIFLSFPDISSINVKKEYINIIDNYDLVISCHCKMIFPNELVNNIRCINIHPGFNPHNRGWYPQVFSIINKLPFGATIHIMDEEIDHGPIIAQKTLPIKPSDTSSTLYEKVLNLEIEILSDNFEDIIEGTYHAEPMKIKGNYNGIENFKKLCSLDLNHVGTLSEHIDYLRALTHDDHKNAYFFVNNKKFYIKLLIDEVDS